MPSKKKLVMPSQNPRFNLGPDRPGQIFFAFSKNAREHLTQQERHLAEGVSEHLQRRRISLAGIVVDLIEVPTLDMNVSASVQKESRRAKQQSRQFGSPARESQEWKDDCLWNRR